MKKNGLLLIAILLSSIVFSQNNKRNKKVLLIGIDGCRPDILLYAHTPHIDQLWQNGAYLFCAQTDPISSSGICWTSMLTGVWHEKHKVLTNRYENPNIKEYPHFFHRVKEQYPNKKTAVVVNWSPVNRILQKNDADIEETYSTDKEVAQHAIKVLQENNPDALFIHFDNVDHTGHGQGYSLQSKPYVESIEEVDSLVGEVLKALKNIKGGENDDWYVILSTDHGGNGYTHGQDIPIHTNIFYIINGPEVKKGEILKPVNVVDVAVTAMEILGVKIPSSWQLDGEVKGLTKTSSEN